jgi:hypothetical protein
MDPAASRRECLFELDGSDKDVQHIAADSPTFSFRVSSYLIGFFLGAGY